MLNCIECEFCKETPPLGICPNVPYMYQCMNPENGMFCGHVIAVQKERFRGYPISPVFRCAKEG